MAKNICHSSSRALCLQGALLLGLGLTLSAQEERRALSKSAPEYPELARRMKLAGIVKVEVTIAPNGSVTKAIVVGGHPLLGESAVAACKHWKFSPSGVESTQILTFKFNP
ncbi:MAG: energy transducer TonB [Acidobacteriia bacterium]|nr:energy transducer TonB [Terriglobia bacterium]